jgi:hypothetical protein
MFVLLFRSLPCVLSQERFGVVLASGFSPAKTHSTPARPADLQPSGLQYCEHGPRKSTKNLDHERNKRLLSRNALAPED